MKKKKKEGGGGEEGDSPLHRAEAEGQEEVSWREHAR